MHLSYEIDQETTRLPRLGLLVLQEDDTIEGDFRRLLPIDGMQLFHSRLPSPAEITSDTLPQMETALPTAAALLPDAAPIDVIGYACTSGAAALGEATVERLVTAEHPGAKVTTPLTALKAACGALGVTRLGLVSPYVADVSQSLIDALERDGIVISAFGSFNQKEDRLVARIARASILAAILEIGDGNDCEAVFASCTNLRAVDVLREAEARLGKPVLASNQVLAWHMSRLAGIADESPQLGALSRVSLKA